MARNYLFGWEIRDWDAIAKDYDAMERMSCVPQGITKVKPDHVFDEDKSVKWNRQKAEDNNERYQQEVARLNTLKNKRRDEILEDIYHLIQDTVKHGLPREKAILIWSLAYERGHAYGMSDIKAALDELMDLASKLLKD